MLNLFERLRSNEDFTERRFAMQTRKFEHVLKQLTALTVRQRQRLLDLLLPAVKCDQTVAVIDRQRVGNCTRI